MRWPWQPTRTEQLAELAKATRERILALRAVFAYEHAVTAEEERDEKELQSKTRGDK